MTVHPQTRAPLLAIGGVGGSGTRVVAEIAQSLGLHMGETLNESLDNLWFTILLKRPPWFTTFPDEKDIRHALELFHCATTMGFVSSITPQDAEMIAEMPLAHRIPAARTQLLNSKGSNLAGKAGWGWKEPNTHIFLPQVAQIFPKLKYVHVIRNGLDMVLSQNQQQLRNWGDFICGDSLDQQAGEMERSLEFWARANRRAIDIGRRMLGERFYILRYDSLGLMPDKELDKLIDFLEIEVEPSLKEKLLRLIEPVSIGRQAQITKHSFTDFQLETVRELGFEITLGTVAKA